MLRRRRLTHQTATFKKQAATTHNDSSSHRDITMKGPFALRLQPCVEKCLQNMDHENTCVTLTRERLSVYLSFTAVSRHTL